MPNLFEQAKPGAAPRPSPATDEPDDSIDTTHPAYLKAMDMVQSKLYEEGGDEALAAALSKGNLEQVLPEQAELMLGLVDDAMQGEVPDELYLMLGIEILGELVDVAKASGMDASGRVVAAATQALITSVVEGLGGDTADVKAAMGQLPPEQVGAALDEMEAGAGQAQPEPEMMET